jgi:PKD repeat protein
VGNATVVWNAGSTVTASSRPAGGAFGPATPISNSAHTAFLEPRVTMTGNGDAIVAWSANGMSSTHIAVAVDDVTPPVLSAVLTPSSADAGIGAAMSASATDTWSTPSISWEFGDGATATGASVSHSYATGGEKTVTITATDAVGNSASTTRTIPVATAVCLCPGRRQKLSLAAKVIKQPWEKINKAGAIKLRCQLDAKGTCAVKATVSAAVAKRLGLDVAKRAKSVKVGKGSAAVLAGKLKVVKVRLASTSRTGIDAATKPVPISLAVTGTASGREAATLSRRLKIRRP